MGQALQKPALRPMLPQDIPVLAEIFAASIEELTEDDYTESQREAWASAVDDEDEFSARLTGQLTLVATLNHSPVGFSSLKGNDHVDMLFVHPSAAHQGVATLLCDAMEKLAAARGASHLTVDASDTAHGFFLKRGYVDQRRNSVIVNDEWLANTTMKKTFAAPPDGTGAGTTSTGN
ncbi:MAG TPA: GNAT family N-acetyltransferase [Xanthobacteraceae bacterium]|nr:GNAT family N-acetyltransferase [Xanthobacteraceae bacterium]